MMGTLGTQASDQMSAKDTVTIEFGNNSKIILLVKDKADLETIKQYDLNAMLQDISIAVDSTKDDNTYLEIEDKSGKRYLSDTTLVLEKGETDLERKRRLDEVNLRIANFKLSAKVEDWEDWEDLEDDLEDLEDGDAHIEKETYIEERTRKTTHSLNVDIGLNNFLEDGEFPDSDGTIYAVKPWGSWFVGINSVQKTRLGNTFFLEWGGNINWYNFKFDNEEARISKTETGVLFFEQPNPDVSSIKSKLTVSYVDVSLVPMLDFGKDSRKVKRLQSGGFSVTKHKKQGFRIGVGGYAGYRLGSHSKVRFKENGNRERDKDRSNFHLNNWRYGVRGQIGFGGTDLFVNYDLNDLFSGSTSPKLNAISFGIIL